MDEMLEHLTYYPPTECGAMLRALAEIVMVDGVDFKAIVIHPDEVLVVPHGAGPKVIALAQAELDKRGMKFERVELLGETPPARHLRSV